MTVTVGAADRAWNVAEDLVDALVLWRASADNNDPKVVTFQQDLRAAQRAAAVAFNATLHARSR